MKTLPMNAAPRLSVGNMLIAVLVLNSAIAVTLHAFGPDPLLHNMVFSHCIGLFTYALIDGPRRRLWPVGAPRLVPMIALVIVAATMAWVLGSMLGGWILGIPGQPFALRSHVGIGFIVLTIAAGFAGTYYFWTREQVAAAEKLATEARLKLLTAQIEPHFLFNTLANLQALIDVDPARAQQMLAHLDRYLRASLAATRSGETRLADEFALARAYLEIIAVRMGPRLAFDLDLPAELGRVHLPPMLLQPLIENAIRHGLEPKVAGGHVRIAARREAAALVVTVEDDGLGLGRHAADTPVTASGIGLANVRERLAAAFGKQAALVLESQGSGTRATLRLPVPT
ncbi:MAG: histidine kinase [Burkholderiales bacterium]|nr:histidine kinase [Burkholderiales bacterium]